MIDSVVAAAATAVAVAVAAAPVTGGRVSRREVANTRAGPASKRRRDPPSGTQGTAG